MQIHLITLTFSCFQCRLLQQIVLIMAKTDHTKCFCNFHVFMSKMGKYTLPIKVCFYGNRLFISIFCCKKKVIHIQFDVRHAIFVWTNLLGFHDIVHFCRTFNNKYRKFNNIPSPVQFSPYSYRDWLHI